MQPDIIALGEPMLEFNATEEGALSEVGRFAVGWGGDTSNFAIAAARMGGSVGYMTRLGDDEFGRSFMNLWKEEGIDTTHVEQAPAEFTGIYFISRKDTRHFFTYYRAGSAAARMTPDFLSAEYISGAKALHVSGISQAISLSACDTVFAAIETAKTAGVKICYDPNLRLKLWPLDRARAIVHQTIAMSDVVLPSLEDATVLTESEDPAEIVRRYLELGLEVVVLKLGEEGALLGAKASSRNTDEYSILKFPPFRVEPVDMSGAGDAFDGAFLVGWLSGWPLEKCMAFANAAGALTTTGLGVVRSIPRRVDVEALMHKQSLSG